MPHDNTDSIERPDWLDHSVWPFTTRTYHHGDQPVHYLDEGDGPAIVFIHVGMWSFIWRDLITQLSTDFRCLTLDYPGAGLTPGHHRDIDLESFVNLTTAWLDHLGIDDAVYVVHDLGGVVGINTAARRPTSVRGVVAINSFAWPPHTRSLQAMLRLMGGPTATGLVGSLRVIPRMTRSKFGVGRHYDRASKRAFYGPYRQRRAAARNFHRVMGSIRHSGDLFEHAESALGNTLAGTPALLVFGENNDPFGFADIWHQYYPHAVSRVIDGGNHFPMCDDPDIVATWISDWHRDSIGSTHTTASNG